MFAGAGGGYNGGSGVLYSSQSAGSAFCNGAGGSSYNAFTSNVNAAFTLTSASQFNMVNIAGNNQGHGSVAITQLLPVTGTSAT